MDFNVEQLMSRIKESAARRKIETPRNGVRLTLAQLQSANDAFDLPEINLSPEFKPKRNNHYHINELLQFHDHDFVRNAYRAILKREPDEPGLNSYLERLRSGRRNKIDILASLRFSAEGRQQNVRVDGLRFPTLVRSLTRLPVIGYAFELVIGLARLPVSISHHRKFEAHAIAQQQLIVDHANRLTRAVRGLDEFVEAVGALREQFTNQQLELSRLQQASGRHEDQLSAHDDALDNLLRQDENLKAQLAGEQETIRFQAETLKHQAELLSQLQETLDEQRLGLRDQRLELSALHARLAMALRTSDQREVSQPSIGPAATFPQDGSLDALFMQVEDRFRGERTELKEKFRFYLPYLDREKITADILDVGCGRGEWLELLNDTGHSARGVDSNRLMVEQCKAAGIDAMHANIFDHFSDVADNSLSALTAFHVIEHLQFDQFVEFIDQSIRTLRPGGLLLLETPNPENVIVATRNFYLDPSHVRPLPGELIEFLLKARGLADIEIVGLHPLVSARVADETELATRINDLFYGPMDYGIIARRN